MAKIKIYQYEETENGAIVGFQVEIDENVKILRNILVSPEETEKETIKKAYDELKPFLDEEIEKFEKKKLVGKEVEEILKEENETT